MRSDARFQPTAIMTGASGERSARRRSTWPAPYGSSPTSEGRVRNTKTTRGSAATRQITANMRKAGRQPYSTITELVTGESTTPPTPDPESATDTASPRLSVNQFAMSTDTSRRVPATTTTPATTHSAYSCHSSDTNENAASTAALVTTVMEPNRRALSVSTSFPTASEANTATTVQREIPVLNWPTVKPRSSTMCGWNSGIQFTNTV